MQVHRDFPPFTARFSSDSVGTTGAGACTRCGRDRKKDDPGVVDIDLQPFGEGVAVLCWPCAQEIGSLTGMATPEKVAKLEAKVADLAAKLKSANAELEAVALVRQALDLMAETPA